MARTFTIGQIIDRARARADMRHTTFISAAEALEMVNEAYTELYDLLVQTFSNYYVTTGNLTLVPGTVSYALPADFYKMIVVERDNADGTFTTIFPFNELEKNSTIFTDTNSIPNATVRLRYVPAPTIFTTTSQTIDGVSGWESLLVYDVAIMMLTAEESDTSALERRRAQIYQRIVGIAQNRDLTIPGSITDVTVFDNAFIKDELRYRFYGSNIEFIVAEYVGV